MDEPLVVLARYCQRVLDSDYLLKEVVREADIEWGRVMSGPTSKEGSSPNPNDPYTVESVRSMMSASSSNWTLAGNSIFQLLVTMTSLATLKLVQESRFAICCPITRRPGHSRRAASSAKGTDYFVVFDDRTTLARITNNLHSSNSNVLIGTAPHKGGYEGYLQRGKASLLLARGVAPTRRRRTPCSIVEYSDAFEYIKCRSLDFVFKSCNKGFEALRDVSRNGRDYHGPL